MMDFPRVSLLVAASVLAACSGASSAAEDPDGGNAPPVDAAAIPTDAAPEGSAPADAGAVDAPSDVACSGLHVDDAGVTHGCGMGGSGIGDHDDGGDTTATPPTVSMDASDLPYGSSCWDNAQCASGLCFDFQAKGTFCTMTCMNTADCPLTNEAGTMGVGCNGMGVCRVQ